LWPFDVDANLRRQSTVPGIHHAAIDDVSVRRLPLVPIFGVKRHAGRTVVRITV
jgi:hypothetical protein